MTSGELRAFQEKNDGELLILSPPAIEELRLTKIYEKVAEKNLRNTTLTKSDQQLLGFLAFSSNHIDLVNRLKQGPRTEHRKRDGHQT